MRDNEALERVLRHIRENPEDIKEVLTEVAGNLHAFNERCRQQRNNEADKVILTLVCVIADWENFSSLGAKDQKRYMKPVIDYHFPNGTKGGYAQGEIDFYKKYASRQKR